MEKPKRWHYTLVALVILLTIYNILPTAIFYTKPLKKSIGENQGYEIAHQAASRLNRLEIEAIDWLKSFVKLLDIKAESIQINEKNPELINLKFHSEKEAEKFKKYLPRAGTLIPFFPSQLALTQGEKASLSTEVTLKRNIPIRFETTNPKEVFTFVQKREDTGGVTEEYQALVNDRLKQLALSIGGESENFNAAETALYYQKSPRSREFLSLLSERISSYAEIFGENSPTARRYYATFTQASLKERSNVIANLTKAFEDELDKIRIERIQLQEIEQEKRNSDSFLEAHDQQKFDTLKSLENRFFNSVRILREQKSSFNQGALPWTYTLIDQALATLHSQKRSQSSLQTLLVGSKNPLIEAIEIDWNSEKLFLKFHTDIQEMRKQIKEEKKGYQLKDRLDQLIYSEIARISQGSGESLTPYKDGFEIALNSLTASQSLLVMEIGSLAQKQASQIKELISSQWNPSHPQLSANLFPIYDFATYEKLPPYQKRLGLIVYAPAASSEPPQKGFRTNSIYVIAKGVQEIFRQLQKSPNSPKSRAFLEDFEKLKRLLRQSQFEGYPGTTSSLHHSFANDFIFEARDFYRPILMATHEDFKVHGTKRRATLEFSNVEQRIYTLNRIETKIHEDLLKWKSEYLAAQANTELDAKLDVPPPTKNPLMSNLALSFRKYFRGDERKILHWGLDLSGGKTVQIEMRDTNDRVVSSQEGIKKGIDELYRRVNKMGVSEVAIRQEGNTITLDFPSAQGLSATDLIKASSMHFHVVNETFSTGNTLLSSSVDQFLQDVWNEAVATNQKDVKSLNLISWKHLYGGAMEFETARPLSQAAKTLYDQGLRIAKPGETQPSSTFNDALSKIAVYRGDSFSDWKGQSHPLLIVMDHYALEGANLVDVRAAYDPSQGNFLTFNVKSSQTLANGQKINPRNDLYNWTKAFSKEKIATTPLGKVTNGRGWRMAVVLNGSIVSAPAIESALSDHISITGSFTQREVNSLEADLKAGSLSFAPYILSEKNVSPELGLKDRYMGILATVLALVLVVLLMVGYYRFAGVIASVAVLFNLLIICATLQNIQATVTLAGIAGIILTVGMAVDANVLVFERIREEFALSKRLPQAIRAGYKKAFSAVLDSNVTTVIAALILLHFDSGPIKGFAITLIIGIASSMFSALFMTRLFFAKWVGHSKSRVLKMSNLIKKTSFDFLKYGKLSFAISLIIGLFGICLFVFQKRTLVGMDFTGGYSLSLELKQASGKEAHYRSNVEAALIKAGLSQTDFQVRELSPSNHVKILLSRSLDQSKKPFEYLPFEISSSDAVYPYENNPRIVWILNALSKQGIEVRESSLKQLETNWTTISGQMSNGMKNNALLGLSLALVCILFYITLRFEFKYAASATLGLAIDVLVTLSFLAIFHSVGTPIQIDLNTIAALMTIIGYSLNDTIIIFDRVRENLKKMHKKSFKEVINEALNVTLSRTLMTSGTTLVVLLALLFLGGSAIFGLSLVMVIGVIFGTFSSLFIASPLLLFFQSRERKKLALKES